MGKGVDGDEAGDGKVDVLDRLVRVGKLHAERQVDGHEMTCEEPVSVFRYAREDIVAGPSSIGP